MENTTQKNYEEAYEELKQITACLENSETKIDELELKIERAEELIAFCKQRLHEVEDRTEELLRRLEQTDVQ